MQARNHFLEKVPNSFTCGFSVCCLKDTQRGNRLCDCKTGEAAKLIKHEMLSNVSSKYAREKNLSSCSVVLVS